MYKLNPLSIADMDEEDQKKIQEAAQMLGGGAQDQQKAQEVADIRKQVENIIPNLGQQQ